MLSFDIKVLTLVAHHSTHSASCCLQPRAGWGWKCGDSCSSLPYLPSCPVLPLPVPHILVWPQDCCCNYPGDGSREGRDDLYSTLEYWFPHLPHTHFCTLVYLKTLCSCVVFGTWWRTSLTSNSTLICFGLGGILRKGAAPCQAECGASSGRALRQGRRRNCDPISPAQICYNSQCGSRWGRNYK